MLLWKNFDQLLNTCRAAFDQNRTFQRARRLMIGLLFCTSRHLTSNAICTTGRQHLDWSADHRLFSRANWDPDKLFDLILNAAVPWLPAGDAPICVALDDTLCRKSGRVIPNVAFHRDPQSPPFHVNLVPGLRCIQFSLILAPPTDGPARAVPIQFKVVSNPPKPRKNAPDEVKDAYSLIKRANRVTAVASRTIANLRQSIDANPALTGRPLLLVADGSYTNNDVIRLLPPNVQFIGRIRKDADLYHPLSQKPNAASPHRGRPRCYGPKAPTPEQLLRDPAVPFVKVSAFAAGQRHAFQVKTFDIVYWRSTGTKLPLRLVVVKPVGYRLRNGAKLLYRQPSFLICTNPDMELSALLQSYIHRWEIECNHRDEKSFVGIAEGQVRNPKAVKRLPPFQVAGYSLLLLASLNAYGFQRSDDYFPLPKWRGESARPSITDIIQLLRAQIAGAALDSHSSPNNYFHFDPLGRPSTKPGKRPDPDLNSGTFSVA